VVLRRKVMKIVMLKSWRCGIKRTRSTKKSTASIKRSLHLSLGDAPGHSPVKKSRGKRACQGEALLRDLLLRTVQRNEEDLLGQKTRIRNLRWGGNVAQAVKEALLKEREKRVKTRSSPIKQKNEYCLIKIFH